MKPVLQTPLTDLKASVPNAEAGDAKKLADLRSEFPILARLVHGKPLAYLDNGATTLKPRIVLEAMNRYYTHETANVHRGIHTLSEEASASYEGARDKIRDFIGAEHREEIIFTRGTTEGVNLVAQSWGRKNLRAGDEILVTHLEHHANIVPWQMLAEEKQTVLKVAPVDDRGELILESFEKLLSPKTKLVSFLAVSNAIGTVLPVREMIRLVRKKTSALILIDAAQRVSHMETKVRDLDCDFLVFSGHKLFGPTGIGILYGKKKFLEAMPPWQGGGDMIRSVDFSGTTYNDLPYKFEAGTPHIAGAIGLGAAVDFVKSVGFDFIHRTEQKLLAEGRALLVEVPGLRI
ncbi:MAG: aminotransferase class V-fold PLP-dependent enzyme, partial [Spirochaetia bacterium]|nr:aminotransferase class V-fold PLP-dependent enzyme [Spirochaetia bacterium]